MPSLLCWRKSWSHYLTSTSATSVQTNSHQYSVSAFAAVTHTSTQQCLYRIDERKILSQMGYHSLFVCTWVRWFPEWRLCLWGPTGHEGSEEVHGNAARGFQPDAWSSFHEPCALPRRHRTQYIWAQNSHPHTLLLTQLNPNLKAKFDLQS